MSLGDLGRSRRDLLVERIERIRTDLKRIALGTDHGDLAVHGQHHEDKPERQKNAGRGDERDPRLLRTVVQERGRHQVHRERRQSHVVKRKAGRGRQKRGIRLERRGVHLRSRRNRLHRIEEPDLDPERFGEERVNLRKKRRTARKIESHRRRSALLRTVEVDGPGDLRIEARQHRATDLRDPVRRLVLVLRDAPERDITLRDLKLLRLLQRASERRGNLLRDGIARDRDRTVVDALAFRDHEGRRLGADVKDDDAIVGVRGLTNQIHERERRDIHELDPETRADDGPGDGLDLVDLRRDDQHRLVTVRRVTDDLAVADHLVDRERDVLLDLVTDHLLELLRAARHRNRREALEGHLPGDGNRDRARLDSLLADDLKKRRRKNRLGVPAVERRGEMRRAVVQERQGALRARLVLGELDRRRPDVQSEKLFRHVRLLQVDEL